MIGNKVKRYNAICKSHTHDTSFIDANTVTGQLREISNHLRTAGA